MADDDQPSEPLLDLFVYAPIGLALEARELIPQLAERGRGQVALARLAGTVAARQGADDPAAVLETVRAVAKSIMGDLLAAKEDDGTGQEPAEADAVPVTDYDTMTAAEIIPTLADRSVDDRLRIEAYERTHRARRTILARLEQLEG